MEKDTRSISSMMSTSLMGRSLVPVCHQVLFPGQEKFSRGWPAAVYYPLPLPLLDGMSYSGSPTLNLVRGTD